MKKLKQLFNEQNGLCYWCNCQCQLPILNKERQSFRKNTATREHLIPRVHGGSNRSPNLKMACQWCNSNRGSMDAVRWKRIAKDPIKREAWERAKLLKRKLKRIRKQRERRIRIEGRLMILNLLKNAA